MTTAPFDQRAGGRERSARPQLPAMRAVLLEQVRAIGFTLRVPMLLAVALAVLTTIAIAIQILHGDRWKLITQPSALPAGVGALLAVAVWVREERFGPGFLWTLPVDRSRHALIKVLAGWVWLMLGVVLYALCLLVLSLIAGDGVLPVETLHVVDEAVLRANRLDLSAALHKEQWAPGALIWAVPFGAATASYLLASAFMLGARHPLRWAVGVLLLFPLSGFVSHVGRRLSDLHWLADWPERALLQLLEGRYGLDSLLKVGTWSLDHWRALDGQSIQVWSAVPNLADWRTAAFLWICAGLLALCAAAFRHRERRRA